MLTSFDGIPEGCKRKFELMKEDYILLKFSLAEPALFGLGCTVDCDFGAFEVCDIQKPSYNVRTGGYDYELRLDAYYWKWKNKLFKYLPESAGQEAAWNLTATLDVHAGIILRNLKALGYNYRGTEYAFSIDGSVENRPQLMAYSNISILDALFEMAKKWECECWITDNVIRFGRCEMGDAVKFEIGRNVESMVRSDSKNEFATRLYVFGSEKNLPKDYRKTDASLLINGVVQRRLMLPEGTPYIDAYPGMTEAEVVERVVVMDGIFPKTECVVGKVGSYTSTVKDESTDNPDDTVTETFYYVTDTSGFAFKKEYILEGEELYIQFQSGKLNGLQFGCTFRAKGETLDGKKLESDVYEIVANEDYGRKLPDALLCPAAGDKFILIGWDSTKTGDTSLVTTAENKLKEEGEKKMAKMKVDPSTYSCRMMSDAIYSEDGLHNLYEAGQRVNLINKAFFESGRVSRVIGFEYALDMPYDSPVYVVGETVSYSRLSDLEEKMDELALNGQVYTGGGGSGVYLIKTNDGTPPSESNTFSARRILKELSKLLRKDQPDSTAHLLKLLDGVVVDGRQAQFNKGAQFGESFAGGLTGTGGRIDGEGYGELRGLKLWEWLEVPELRFNSVKVWVGIDWQVCGAGIIESVTPDLNADGLPLNTGTAKLKLEEGQYGAVAADDIAMGIWHMEDTSLNAVATADDSRGNFSFAGFHTFYFRITQVSGAHNDTFRYSLRSGFPVHPQPQMHFACYGNFTNKERQTSTYRTPTYTRRLWKQDTWEIGVRNIAAQDGDLSNLNVHGLQMDGYSAYLNSVYFSGAIKQVKPDGTPVLTANDRGAWAAGEYDYGDRVSHNGCIWLCVAGAGTTAEPSESSADWLKQVDKGQDGSPGADGRPGKDGESVNPVGDWKSGMYVPRNGMVRMGGATWLCKAYVGTYNPPLWTYSYNGRRLLYDGHYLLTGETNTGEYQLVAQDGSSGADGKPGKDGADGIQGCILRKSEWKEGTRYVNDGNKTAFPRYLDVVLVRADDTASGWNAYRCRKDHTSTAGNKPAPAGNDCWEPFGIETTAIFTSLVIAKDASIDFMQGNQLLIKNNDNKIELGLTGGGKKEDGTELTPVRIWAGSETPDDAPFRVLKDGTAYATKLHISGESVFEGEVVAQEKATIGNFILDGYFLRNKDKNTGCCISIENNQSNSSRMAMIGDGLPAYASYHPVALFAEEGQSVFDSHVPLVSIATGCKDKWWLGQDVFTYGGYANIAFYGKGGCDWAPNENDYWSMPGLLKVIRIYQHPQDGISIKNQWGNGLEIISVGYENAHDGVGDGQYSIIKYRCTHDNIFALAMNNGTAWGITMWDLNPVVIEENVVVDSVQNIKKVTLTFWNNRQKYMPHHYTVFFFGFPEYNNTSKRTIR